MRLVVGVAVVASWTQLAGAAPAALEVDSMPGPGLEAKDVDATLQLPVVPSFEVPARDGDVIDPYELRVNGTKLLDTKLQVKGYIIWIYDCVTALRGPKQSRAQVQKQIDEDPTQCERPKFYLGSAKDTPLERGLWVVDVPRNPNKLERARLPKEELAAWPKVPTLKRGSYVVVTGDFKLESPHRERNSDGLLVFESIAPAKAPKVAKRAVEQLKLAAITDPTPAARPKVPPRSVVDPMVKNVSKVLLAKGNRAHGSRQFDDAIELYRGALTAWDGNHLAWYGLGGAYAGKGDWIKARDAMARTAVLRPDQPMYHLWAGVSSYEASLVEAKQAKAAKAGVSPNQVSVDHSSVVFDTARAHLETGIALAPRMWRAQYYLGRIHRAAGRARAAAEAFTRAAHYARTEQGPWIALTELYRKWEYLDAAVAVAELGTKNVGDGPDASDVHFVLGMAHDDRGALAKAIPAFTRALELKPENHRALFRRGQAYFRLRKRADAKRDLEAFIKLEPPSLSFFREQAQTMLLDLLARGGK